MDVLFQRAAGHELHRDVTDVAGDHRLVHVDDVRVVQRAGQRGLVLQVFAVLAAVARVFEEGLFDDLDRDFALAERVESQEHFAGRAVADLAQDAVVAKEGGGAGRLRGCGGCFHARQFTPSGVARTVGISRLVRDGALADNSGAPNAGHAAFGFSKHGTIH